MKRKVSRLRLSPNEEARIIREEHERRRKLRIQQVREQQRYIALQIRREVEQRRQQGLRQLEQELREDWERQQREKLQTLHRLYQESLQLLGQSHRSAKENEPDFAAIAQKEEENHAKAEERYQEALKELKTQKIKDQERQKRLINARKKALQVEKERSAKVASLPPPPPNLIQENIDPKKPHKVKRCDLSAFATTHYHMTESAIEREAQTIQVDAHEEAQLEAQRLQELQKEERRRREEQLEKARLRGRQALRREQLVQDRDRLLVELEHMQQTDLLRRRQQVSQMPPQIFQPLYKRQETREDFQRDMEFAFEDMYTGERRVKGDLVVQLVPEPLPESSAGSHDQELDVTLDETAENVQIDSEQEVGSNDEETSAEAEAPSKPAPRQALRKLLDRIRNQRNEWINNSSQESPTVSSDQIPERDSTIESGSLPSEEKDQQTPIEVHKSTVPPPVMEPLPDVFVSRIQEFEEERKKREEELEKEKQQHLFLLQELEEQKTKLEQMLLEAQQERERLKAAMTQEAALNQTGAAVQNQEVTAGLTTQLAPPAGEDDHSRRIREYQQRLLEQNRVHQRSVEVARQRLEEYQRALQIRHNMTSRSLPPAVRLPGFTQPPSDHPPAPLHLHTTPVVPSDIHNEPQVFVDLARRDSEVLTSPPRPASSGSVGSKLPSNDSVSNTLRIQRPDVTAQLTEDIMTRVTEHLPERLRPSPVTIEQLPYRLFTRNSTSSQSTSDQSRFISPSISNGAPPDPGLQSAPLISREEGMKRQRQELQEAQRRVMEQREAVMEQQRLQEEERRRKQMEMEQMRRQKETLQALIKTNEQPVLDTPSETLSEDVSQNRLRLLASLLRVIEESNGETLSHLEDPEEMDDPFRPTRAGEICAPEVQSYVPPGPPQISVPPSGLVHPPRVPKPPVTRVKLGFNQMMTEQHELSAIQEVETSINISQVAGPGDNGTGSQDPQEESESLVSSDGTLQTPSVCSSGQGTAERRVSSETSSHLLWRERLLSGAGTSPERSDSDSIQKVMSSPLSSDSGRGADFSGPANVSYRSPTEPLSSPPQSDCLSATVSSGSYISTDPEQNTNKYLPSLVDVSSLCGGTLSSEGNSPAGCPAPSVDSVFNDGSVQRIIDKYTQELSVSLSAATGRRTEEENSTGHQSLSAGTRRSVLHLNIVNPLLEPFSGEDLSLTEDQEQDSFRPLIGHPANQSSCLAADERESVLEQLVGQPSAHSSMIGHLPGPLASPSFDRGGWDSALSRMIGHVSHPSSSDWPSPPGQVFTAGRPMGRVVSELSWLEESLMRPLVGELDESADQHNDSSGERSRLPVGPSHQTFPPEASAHSVPDLIPPPQDQTSPSPQDQTSAVILDPHRAEEDSFHLLPAEVTHNETADPSMTFHLLEHNLSDIPEGLPGSSEHSVSTPPVGFDSSPEQLRSEEPNHSIASTTSSFSQLVISECHPQESALILSPNLNTNVEQSPFVLSNLIVCGDKPALGAEIPNTHNVLDPVDECYTGGMNQRGSSPASEEILEAASERGILEQSEITLVSLTDTTLQDDETTVNEEEEGGGVGSEDNKDGQEVQEKGFECAPLPEETPEDSQTHPVTFLEFQWDPRGELHDIFQQRRTALLQRSSCRVERIKAKGARTKRQPEKQDPFEEREPAKANQVVPVTCKAKTSSEPQQKTKSRAKAGLAAQKKTQLQPQVSDSSIDNVYEMKTCTTEQRKQNLSEMHKRTQRLYEQLEEVKQQKTIRNRRDDYAKNRLKAKEFHKKTLQKLRAKQTQH